MTTTQKIAAMLEEATDAQRKAFTVACMENYQGVKNYGNAVAAGFLAAEYGARMKVVKRHREIMASESPRLGEIQLDRWQRIWGQAMEEVYAVAEEAERAWQLALLEEILA